MSKDRVDTYVQVPHSIEGEPFYADDHLLAAWLRLYLAASTAYPFLAPLPRIKQDIIDALAAAGRIELAPNDRYVIPGLAEKRAASILTGQEGGRKSLAASVRGPDGRFYPRRADQPPAQATANAPLVPPWTNEPSYVDVDVDVDVDELTPFASYTPGSVSKVVVEDEDEDEGSIPQSIALSIRPDARPKKDGKDNSLEAAQERAKLWNERHPNDPVPIPVSPPSLEGGVS